MSHVFVSGPSGLDIRSKRHGRVTTADWIKVMGGLLEFSRKGNVERIQLPEGGRWEVRMLADGGQIHMTAVELGFGQLATSSREE